MPDQPMYDGHVTMAHPDHKDTWDCPVDYVPTAREQGWKPVDEHAAGLYDPSAHGVDEVTKHLAGLNDDAEVQRILDAERAGKNRTTITGD